MTPIRWAVALVALAAIALSVLRLEGARSGLDIARFAVGPTPVTAYALPGSDGPAVVVAHGFAGSRQLMEAYALTLARAGYRVLSFDFEGHGRHSLPMGGDVNAIDGTTRRLIDQTRTVIDHAARLTDRPVALLGHSMASDVLVRAATEDDRTGPLVLVSAFSGAIGPEAPGDMLLITGEWEPGLREAAVRYVQMVAPAGAEGAAVSSGEVRRKAVVAPRVEHVGVLYSATGLEAARDWLDAAYGGQSAPAPTPVAATGGWIALLLAGLVVFAWPLSALLPAYAAPPGPIPRGTFWAAMVLPALVTPVALSLVEVSLLPVLVADYLALHLFFYGLLALAVLWRGGVRLGAFALWPTLALLVYGIGVFGFALDRYAASFMPTPERLWIIAAVALGAVPFMVSDAVITRAGAAPYWQRLLARGAFLGSLGLAVALDFDALFFLIMILPVIVLFFVIFGQMGSWAGRRTGLALVPGLALGICLAWAIGVSFPLFSA